MKTINEELSNKFVKCKEFNLEDQMKKRIEEELHYSDCEINNFLRRILDNLNFP